MGKKSKQASEVYADGLGDRPKPSMRIDKIDYPKIKELKIDDELTFTVKVRVVELSRDTYMEKPPISARVEVQSMKQK